MPAARSDNFKTNEAKADSFGQSLYQKMVSGGASKSDAKSLANRAAKTIVKLASLKPEAS